MKQEPARGHRCGWPHALYRTILVKIITSPGARALHHGCRVMETAYSLDRGHGAYGWLRQERAGGRCGG